MPVRHSKDRLFVTSGEFERDYGGKKAPVLHGYKPLSFDHCGLGLTLYSTPVCLKEGVVFEQESLMEHLLAHKTNPVTGERDVTSKDIITLNMDKNCDGKWCCPVTQKVFTNSSHIVAIKITGNVYSYDAVLELCIKPKQYFDLITGDAFKKEDIITLVNPLDDANMKLRDINNFAHMRRDKERGDSSSSSSSLSTSLSLSDSAKVGGGIQKVRHNVTTDSIMREIDEAKQRREASGEKQKSLEDYAREMNNGGGSAGKEFNEDVQHILSLEPLIVDINPGQANTDGRASSSFTSSSSQVWTSNKNRLATAEEIRNLRWKTMKSLGKKALLQIQTTLGNLNIEVHCDITPKTSWNFLSLALKNYYNGVTFHRVIPSFMAQGGDPTGTGSGGMSAFGRPFEDECDQRLLHSSRGILSMANSGLNSNKSQFFITFSAAKHLDMKHSVFGRVVGGLSTLDSLETTECDKKNRPIQEVKILNIVVFQNPILEADELMLAEVKRNIANRLQADLSGGSNVKSSNKSHTSATPNDATSSSSSSIHNNKRSASDDDAIREFLQSQNKLFSSSVDSKKKAKVDPSTSFNF